MSKQQFIQALERVGVCTNSPRFTSMLELLATLPETLGPEQINSLKMSDVFLSRALDGDLVIKDFQQFTNMLSEIYDQVVGSDGGRVASYIPQLARVNPEQFGVSACSIDGQQWRKGDAGVYFCMQSISKTVTYLIALELHGETKVHSHVGREPSGVGFNERVLNAENLPHNPFINSGAIMCSSLIKPEESMSNRFDYVMDYWARLTGGRPTFANSTYLGERATADRNYCLAYMMNESKAFPPGTDLSATLDFYFMMCSIEVTTEMLAVAGSTLASGGVCPVTGERVFQEKNVRDCLSMMASCGLYDGSGEFFFDIGLPTKSGVAGGIMIVIPGVAGLCTFSPRLESHGNSYRGLRFCRRLADSADYHQFSIIDSFVHQDAFQRVMTHIGAELLFAVSQNNLPTVRALLASRPDAINYYDYDLRTPLHIAASNGYLDMCKYLVAHGACKGAVDLLKHTPMDDAKREQHTEIINYLRQDTAHSEIHLGDELDPTFALFAALDDTACGTIQRSQLVSLLQDRGIINCSNWQGVYDALRRVGETVTVEEFTRVVEEHPILRLCITNNVVIPEWETFINSLTRIYQNVAPLDTGKPWSTTITRMATESTDRWEVSFCSVSGQRFDSPTNSAKLWSVRSMVHIVNYLIAQDLLGETMVHEYVGKEPSGRNFNEFSLNSHHQPHNPAITSGALAIISLIKPELSVADRFQYLLDQWQKLTLGPNNVVLDEDGYEHEKETVSRKWTLAYMLLDSDALPDHIQTHDQLRTNMDLYCRALSLLANTDAIAVAGAVLANGGVNPFTGERLYDKKHVRNVLSIMYACGMYDSSGEFTFRVGIPASSGEGGGILAVAPGLGAFCTFSPLLDSSSNSVRGVEFYRQLADEFNIHSYETLVRHKKDPRVFGGGWNHHRISRLLKAGSKGDLVEVQKELAFVDINSVDYDNRTVLHIAAANNHKQLVQYLLEHGADPTIKDRWGHAPRIAARTRTIRRATGTPLVAKE